MNTFDLISHRLCSLLHCPLFDALSGPRGDGPGLRGDGPGPRGDGPGRRPDESASIIDARIGGGCDRISEIFNNQTKTRFKNTDTHKRKERNTSLISETD